MKRYPGRFLRATLTLLLALALAVMPVMAAGAIQLPPIQLPPLEIPMPDIPIPVPDIQIPVPDIQIPVPDIQIPVPDIQLPVPDVQLPAPDLTQGSAQTDDGAWPATGEIYHNPAQTQSDLQLTIRIKACGEGEASYIKVYKGDELVSGLFIGGVGEASAMLGAGVYQLKLGSGKTWLGEEEAFGKDGAYQTLLFYDDESEVTLETGLIYTLTINTPSIDSEADDVGARDESWEGF